MKWDVCEGKEDIMMGLLCLHVQQTWLLYWKKLGGGRVACDSGMVERIEEIEEPGGFLGTVYLVNWGFFALPTHITLSSWNGHFDLGEQHFKQTYALDNAQYVCCAMCCGGGGGRGDFWVLVC